MATISEKTYKATIYFTDNTEDVVNYLPKEEVARICHMSVNSFIVISRLLINTNTVQYIKFEEE